MIINGDSKKYAITVSGKKYASTLADSCVIKITNMSYGEIIKIIDGKFYNVTLYAGYESIGEFEMFEGGIFYISNVKESLERNVVKLLCTSHLLASYGQSLISLSFNAGVNMYSILSYLCELEGVSDASISQSLKDTVLSTELNLENQSLASVIDAITSDEESSIVAVSDGITSLVTVYDWLTCNTRLIKITADKIIANQYPNLTTDGLTMTILPTFQLCCGDTLEIDNSLIQIDVTDTTSASKNYAYYIDNDGRYIIFSISYTLANRSSSYYYTITAKSRSLLQTYLE